jgi:peptide-methionine (S)-S-oxide reductase
MSPTLQLALGGGALLALAALGACVAQRARPVRPLTRGGDPAPMTTATTHLPPLDLAVRDVRYETATFAVGWFWTPDSRFGGLEGVLRTRVGYTGGTTPHPTYKKIGDHTEAFQVDFDPSKLTYEQLLERFWSEHDPTHGPWSTQYKAAVWTHDATQAATAARTRDALAARLGVPVRTEVLPLGTFTLAEDYHQKYYLRHHEELMAELAAYFDDTPGLIGSTAVARLNGWLAGHATSQAQVERELPLLGLSAEGQARVRASFGQQATCR